MLIIIIIIIIILLLISRWHHPHLIQEVGMHMYFTIPIYRKKSPHKCADDTKPTFNNSRCNPPPPLDNNFLRLCIYHSKNFVWQYELIFKPWYFYANDRKTWQSVKKLISALQYGQRDGVGNVI